VKELKRGDPLETFVKTSFLIALYKFKSSIGEPQNEDKTRNAIKLSNNQNFVGISMKSFFNKGRNDGKFNLRPN